MDTFDTAFTKAFLKVPLPPRPGPRSGALLRRSSMASAQPSLDAELVYLVSISRVSRRAIRVRFWSRLSALSAFPDRQAGSGGGNWRSSRQALEPPSWRPKIRRGP